MRKWLALFVLFLSCVIVPEPAAQSPKPTVLVARMDAEDIAKLREAVPEARIVPVADEAQALKHIAKADALVGIVSQDLIKKGKRLRWVHVYSAGVDRYRYPELVAADFTFTNSKVIQGPNVADQAMALLLVLTRRIHDAVRAQPQHDWRGSRNAVRDAKRGPVELDGKTALVVGLGGIGTAIGQRAKGFGMKVVGIKRDTSQKPDWVESVHTSDALPELLPQADVVFVAVPLTDETEGMIGKDAFAAMKDGAFLVNIARGKIIDTDAMVDAIKAGRLGGVGLDVTDPEPLPAEHPLWDLPDVVITPHVGGTSDRVWVRRFELTQRNLESFVAGKPLENVVDKKAGY